MLMKSTGRYVYHRLGTQETKAAYHLAMKDCIAYVSSGLQSLDLIKSKIEGLRTEADHNFPNKMFNKRLEEKHCFNMAINHAMDIVNSLEARFITGQSDSEPRGYKGYGILYDNTEELFK